MTRFYRHPEVLEIGEGTSDGRSGLLIAHGIGLRVE